MRTVLLSAAVSGLVAVGVLHLGSPAQVPSESIERPRPMVSGSLPGRAPVKAAGGKARQRDGFADDGAAEKRVAMLAGALERTNARLERLERELRRRENRPVGTDAPALTRDEVELEEAELSAQDRLRQRRQDELERQFASEFVDPIWVEEMDSRLEASLPQLSSLGLKDTRLVFHECRGTLCAAEFVHGRHDDPKFLPLALAMPGIGQITVVPEETPDGEQVSIVYLHREGYGELGAGEQPGH